MSTSSPLSRPCFILLWLGLLAGPIPAFGEEPGWISLIGEHELAAWRNPRGPGWRPATRGWIRKTRRGWRPLPAAG